MIGSPQTLWGVFLLSLVFTLCSVFFWNKILVTGAYFWVTNDNVVSACAREMAAGLALGLLALTRCLVAYSLCPSLDAWSGRRAIALACFLLSVDKR